MAPETALLEIGVMFAAIAVAGGIAGYAGQSVIPFYIISGMVLSEFVIGRIELPVIESGYVSETAFIVIGAELGIVLLLFFLGLEFNLERLFEARGRISRAGTIDLVINFGIGLILGFVLFRELLPAVLVAGIVYISSSAIITKSLIDQGWIANDEAEPMLGTLVYEDLVIAVYLAVVTALVVGGGSLSTALPDIGTAIAFILALLVFVYIGTGALEQMLENSSMEALVLRTLGVTVLLSGAALALGVSEAVAAFFVGMAFSATEWVEEIERHFEPIRDVFAAIFFFWVGLITDPALFGGVVGMVALAVVLTTVSKLISGYLGGLVYDLDATRSTRVALGMVTRGEFSLIIAAIALAGAGTSLSIETAETIYSFAVAYVLVMSIQGTTLMQFSTPIERAVAARLSN